MSRGAHLLAAVFGTYWAIREDKLNAMLAFLDERGEGARFSAEEIAARIGEARAARSEKAAATGVAVLPLWGIVSHRAHMVEFISGPGGTSTELFGRDFDQALADSKIGTIVLDIDSPGGSVSGVPELAQKIYDARGQKKIVAVANSLAASAAYWIGSAADEFVVTPSGEVGSIGVFAIHTDTSRRDANLGVQRTILKAGRHKAEGVPFQPLDGDARAYAQQQIDEFYGLFIDAVARHRGVGAEYARGEKFGEGRTVTAKQALSTGMIDRIGTLEQVLADLGVSPSASGKPLRERRAASEPLPLVAGSFTNAPDLVTGTTGTAGGMLVEARMVTATTGTTAGDPTVLLPEAREGASAEPSSSLAPTAPQAKEQPVSTQITPAPGTPGAPEPNAAQAELDRQTRIRELCELVGADFQALNGFITQGTSVEDARKALQAARPKAQPISGVRMGADRTTEAPWESFGHFAKAVYEAGRPGAREVDMRLFAAATGINQASPSEGGFAVPGTYARSLWDGLFSDPTSLLSMTDNYDVEGAFIEFPRIEETTRAGGTVYGGVQAYWRNEADQITSSKPKFGQMRLEPQELNALVFITEKHLNNSPFAMGQYIDRMGKAAIALKVNAALIAGDGAGKPKGLTTSGAKITVTKETSQAADTILAKNIGKMKARRIASVASQYVWLANTDVQPELDNLSTIVQNVAGTENVGGYGSPLYNPETNRLGGLPVVFNDHCEALGDEGDIILTHLKSYAVGLRGTGVQTAQSMHLRFDYKEMAFRFDFEIDGQSWLHTALTPAKGSTKSTIITLQAR